MRFLALLALAVALHAEDTKPLATVEELIKQVAEQQKEIAQWQAYAKSIEVLKGIITKRLDTCFESYNGLMVQMKAEQQATPKPTEKK